MKTFIAFACLVAAVLAVGHEDITVLSRSETVDPNGFKLDFSQSDGQEQHQSGVQQGDSLAQTGSFKWVSPEGETISLSYVADENGYQPTGAHLPVSPPVPDHVVRLIKYLEEHGAHE